MTIPVRYVGPFDEVTINTISPAGVPVAILVAAGEIVEAPDWLAGHAPSDDDPGAGLLAQPVNWTPAGPPATDEPTLDAGQAAEHDSTGDPGETGATP